MLSIIKDFFHNLKDLKLFEYLVKIIFNYQFNRMILFL